MSGVEIVGLNGDPALAARVQRWVAEVLRRLHVAPIAARVAFVDDNGPRGGGIRCTVTVRVPYQPALRVERTAHSSRLAFDGAVSALGRPLARYHERQRERRRRPKKYDVARRQLA